MGFIYKYRPCNEFTKAIFTTGCLHYSHPCDFNDPYDCMFYLNKKKLHIFRDSFKDGEFPIHRGRRSVVRRAQ